MKPADANSAADDRTAGSPHGDSEEVDEYRVAPLPETFGTAQSPAYRPAPHPGPADTYAVGPEVEDSRPFSIGAQGWREAAAGVRRDVEPFDLSGDPLPEKSPSEGLALRRALERRAEMERTQLAGTGEDPQRFTLRSLFFLVTSAAVVFAWGRSVPRPVFAGVSGAAAFAALMVVQWVRHGSAYAKTAWYALLLVYLVAAVFAALGL